MREIGVHDDDERARAKGEAVHVCGPVWSLVSCMIIVQQHGSPKAAPASLITPIPLFAAAHPPQHWPIVTHTARRCPLPQSGLPTDKTHPRPNFPALGRNTTLSSPYIPASCLATSCVPSGLASSTTMISHSIPASLNVLARSQTMTGRFLRSL
jgi:hypothetical protein